MTRFISILTTRLAFASSFLYLHKMINGTPGIPAGRRLPDDWQKQAAVNAKMFDDELKNQLENAWKKPKWSSKFNYGLENVTRAAMLSSKKPEEQQ